MRGKDCSCGCVSSPLVVSGIIFGIVALVHLYRIFHFFPVTFGTVVFPEWWSYVAFIVLGLLSVWMFVSSRCCCKCCGVCTHKERGRIVEEEEMRK